MFPSIALLLCLMFISYSFWIDKNTSSDVSKAVWIPFIWMCIGGSRYVGHWLNLGTYSPTFDVYTEGSPVDRAVFLLLIIAGIIVLNQRKASREELFKSNIWVWLYFLFGLISISWSDFPYVAFKRWVKGIGTVIMVLIIITEAKPYKALGILLRRMAFLLLPLSVLFIKYYPHLGRAYHMGLPTFTGVAAQKNGLGLLCLVSGIYFSWLLLFKPLECSETKDKIRLLLYAAMVIMIAWLFYKADSATSLFCMFVAIFIHLLSKVQSFRQNPQRLVYFIILSLVMAIPLDTLFGLKDMTIALLGREPSLTTRVPMWNDLMSMVRNPILGFGYDSFWLGERQQIIYQTWWIAHSAHNGYLEMYLNLGLIGMFFLLSWFITGLKKIVCFFRVDYSIGVLRFTMLLIAAIYSYTEATFYGVSLMWVLFFLAIMDPPSMKRAYPILTDNLEEVAALDKK